MLRLKNKLQMQPYGGGQVLFTHRIFPLHSMVSGAGFSRENNHTYDWPGLKRGKTEFILFQYTLSGRGMLTYEGVSYEQTQNHAMLLHIPHDHRYFFPAGSSHWEFFYICMNGMDLIRICKEIESQLGPDLIIDGQSPIIQAATVIVLKAMKHELKDPFQTSKLVYSFIMELSSLLKTLQDVNKNRPAPILKALRYAEQHMDDLDVEKMAETAGYSRFHFTRLFTASEGISPGSYILQLKIQKAVHLLQSTNLSLKEIAAECGFYDSTHFCKLFRNTIGTTPKEFRNSGMFIAK